ncbi:hypothetical protein Tco_1090159 [Tanacetum coccineum]|uniref:RNA-directed DNA polymerase, eukaryota n=1 Tax=Tanacetum coccineum TaxID=301880 RepID=A0ABQ5I3N9_9ASTR
MDITTTAQVYIYLECQTTRGGHGDFIEIDALMGNLDFIDAFPGAYAVFQPYRISDHSPSVLKIPSLVSTKPKPFKFYNFLCVHKPRFKELLFNTWSIQVDGHNMYKCVADANPMDTNLRDEEAVYLNAFNEAKLDEERFLRQKANVEWLEAGDSNSSYFHKMVKARNQYCRIKVILDSNNVEVAGALVPEVFVNHYEEFLGNHSVCDDLNIDGLFHSKVSDQSCLNWYTQSTFLKRDWDVVGDDVCNAVRDFFLNDDLFMFARGDVNSVRVIMEALDEFKLTSGLVPSIPKSTAYFCNVSNNVKIAILQNISFF